MKSTPVRIQPNHMRLWVYFGGMLGLVLSVLCYAPAAWLASTLATATDNKVLLQATRGTIWQGSGQLTLSSGRGPAGRTQLPSRLSWQISPSWQGLTVRFDAPCCTTSHNGGASSPAVIHISAAQKWTLSAPSLRLPVNLLVGLGAPWNSLQLAGELHLSSPALTGDSAGNIAGTAQLEALDITTALSTVRPLGSYVLRLSQQQLMLSTQGESALLLQGTGQIAQGQLRFRGEATAAVGREAALANLLHIIGQRQMGADGKMRSILSFG